MRYIHYTAEKQTKIGTRKAFPHIKASLELITKVTKAPNYLKPKTFEPIINLLPEQPAIVRTSNG